MTPERLSERLTAAARAHQRAAGTLLRRVGLHPGQDRTLLALARLGPATAAAIAEELDVERPTVVKAVRRLQEGGHVHRTPGPAGSRTVLIELTESGRELAQQAHDTVRRIEELTTEPLSAVEEATLEELLERVEDHLRTVTAD